MNDVADARIEIVFVPEGRRGADDAVLIEQAGTLAADGLAGAAGLAFFSSENALTGHVGACSCCTPHRSAAVALHGLFLARAKGEVNWFNRVLALVQTAAGRRAVVAACGDPIVAARFRLSALPE